MELIIIILFILIFFLFYKIGVLNKHINVLSFAEKNITKLLVKKELIKTSEIDTVINESIGDIPEDVGNKIIEDAKSLGIIIPKYMDEKELEKYIKLSELKRNNDKIPFTDRMLMNDYNL